MINYTGNKTVDQFIDSIVQGMQSLENSHEEFVDNEDVQTCYAGVRDKLADFDSEVWSAVDYITEITQ